MSEVQGETKKPTITVFLCVKDGIHFIEAWLENTRPADYLVIQDGGSTDGTREILIEELRKNPKRITLLFQNENDPKYEWNEQKVRNQCLGLFPDPFGWVLLQDVDELISKNFWEWFKESSHHSPEGIECVGYYIPHHNLWLNKDTFNVNPPWYPDLTLRLFKNHRGFLWVGSEHASLWHMDGVCNPNNPHTPIAKTSDKQDFDIYFTHYHRWEPEYRDAVLNDKILHHSDEKKNMLERPILARLRQHPEGAGLIRKRFL